MNKETILKVMTYNAWGLKVGPFSVAKDYQERINSLPSEIYRIDPDIIFLQEIWKKSDRHYIISELDKRGFRFSYYKSEKHPMFRGWQKKFQWLNRLMLGNGLLIISKHEIDLSTAKAVSFSHHTATEEFFTRKGALFCKVKFKEIGVINCVNTHLGSIDYLDKKLNFNSKQKVTQKRQLDELEKFVNTLDPSTPLFIGADLNIDDRGESSWFPSPTKEYTKLVENLNLIDSYRLIHPNRQGVTYSNHTEYKSSKNGPDARLDYLFHANLGNSIMPKTSNLVFDQPIRKNNQSFYLSDHFGIMSEYKLK